MDDVDHSAHLTDVKRDAVAIWRAVLAEDWEGACVTDARTSCRLCLVIQTVIAGLFAAADARLGEDGRILLPRPVRARLNRRLWELLAGVQDRGQVSR